MTYVDAIKTVLNHSNKDQIFQRSSYLCAYLADLIGGDLSQKHLLDILSSLIKNENPNSLFEEKELTRIANKNVFYPKEEVYQALSPFLQRTTKKTLVMPRYSLIRFSRPDMICLNKRKELSLKGVRALTIDIPCGGITVLSTNLNPVLGNKSYFTVYGKGNDLPKDALLFGQDGSENASYSFSFDEIELKKIKKLSFLFEIVPNTLQSLCIKSVGNVIVNSSLKNLQIETRGSVVLNGNYINTSISTSGNVINNALGVCLNTFCF